jgi:serine/threonine protein kinase
MDKDPLGLVGTTIDGKYSVEAFVEETSLSLVYRAVHRVWRRPVAIKAFKIAQHDDESRKRLLDAFVREGVLLMELSERCSAICQARDVSALTTARGVWVPYMVLEWLEGESLDAILTRERGSRPRSVTEAIRLLNPVARALSLAHERGIVHRDVKPGNIVVVKGGTKLLDFGVAAVMDDPAHSGEDGFAHSFTPAYGAPEQVSREHGTTGPWTDVYALALVFVELVTGRAPLGGGSIARIMMRSCDPLVRPTPRALGVPVADDVERVLGCALAVRPEDRFATVSQLWSALKRAAPPGWVDYSSTMPIPLRRRRWRFPWTTAT